MMTLFGILENQIIIGALKTVRLFFPSTSEPTTSRVIRQFLLCVNHLLYRCVGNCAFARRSFQMLMYSSVCIRSYDNVSSFYSFHLLSYARRRLILETLFISFHEIVIFHLCLYFYKYCYNNNNSCICNCLLINMVGFFIFILLSRESDGGAMHRTNPDSLRSCICFRIFQLSFASDFFNLLLVRFHQAEIIVMKHLIQGRNNEAWVGVEPSILRSWQS